MPTTTNTAAKKPRETPPAHRAALAALCHTHRLREKWLVVPNRRVGQQWVDAVARAGQPVVHLHLHTPLSLALACAGPDLLANNRRLLTPLGREIIAARLLRDHARDYFGPGPASRALAARVAATLHELRLAGMSETDLEQRGRFEAVAKGREFLALFRAYPAALAAGQLVDDADVFRAARPVLPAAVLVIAPADLDLPPLAQKFFAALPVDQCARLPVEEVATPTFTATFRALGETNELRAVLRHCLANGWPLDTVELLHTDATYESRLYELAAPLAVPVTFAGGIPARYSRPGRALAAWLAWIAEDYPQAALGAMMRDGLLDHLPAARAGAWRGVPIGFGSNRYLPQLDAHMAGLEKQASDADPERRPGLLRQRAALAELRAPVARLLKLADRPLLEAAAEFLKEHARCVNELDNYARDVLLDRIAELREWLTDDALNPREWLADLLREVRVLGQGPRPGHLYVAGWEAGGHSGRPHTFLVGLDANRFPPLPRQDPVLLDSERAALSPNLPTVATARDQSTKRLARLLGRLRGEIIASYSCRDIAGDADLFPGTPALADAPVVGAVPSREEAALAETDWWLWRLCGATAARAPSRLVGDCFPWLGRGQQAAAHRASVEFTAFDGCVPAAGPDLDPAGAADRLFSAHRLEMMGKCPLRYFYRYALGLEEPEELELDPHRWLPPAEFGQLLHEVFHRHLRDQRPLADVLAERIERYREKFPPPTEGVFRRERRLLERATRVFARTPRAGLPIDFECDITNVALPLPDGSQLVLRGRIDRVDETPAGLELWDYKTGNPNKFVALRKDPFQAGRFLQHALYVTLAQQHYGRPVARFGYFFPTDKGHGEQVVFTPADLRDAPAVLGRLRALIAAGAFPATTSTKDCDYCDYAAVCRAPAEVVAQSTAKLAATGNAVLEPFRELRSPTPEDA